MQEAASALASSSATPRRVPPDVVESPGPRYRDPPGQAWLTDRFGTRSAIVGSNRPQLLGFPGYLVVDSFPHLLFVAVAIHGEH